MSFTRGLGSAMANAAGSAMLGRAIGNQAADLADAKQAIQEWMVYTDELNAQIKLQATIIDGLNRQVAQLTYDLSASR